jgi:hypothetical protein
MLATPDVEMVLRVLEWSLRDVSIETVRDGQRITVRGLGPSQRTMNRNDIAVVDVATEDHQTVVRADITYQASALLGTAPQDELVRSKLDRVLDRVRMELGTKSLPGVASWSAELMGSQGGEVPEVVNPVEFEHYLEPEMGGRREQFAEPAVEAEPVHEVEPVVEAEPVCESEPEVVAVENAPVTSRVESIAVEADVGKPAAVVASHVPERGDEVPIFQSFHPEEETKTPKRWGLLATLACMLAAVGLFVAWPYLVGLVHERMNPSSTVAEEKAAVGGPEVAKHAADAQMPDANSVIARNEAIHKESDPRVWLESLADAMRGQDAGEQALFYADPVEHYALKSNVSNADVWLDKKNAIQSRSKVWTVNLEDVVIEPRPDESLRVRLTKHYTSGQVEGGKVSEQYIHSQLKLKKIDGQWKITSEQNFAPAR